MEIKEKVKKVTLTRQDALKIEEKLYLLQKEQPDLDDKKLLLLLK